MDRSDWMLVLKYVMIALFIVFAAWLLVPQPDTPKTIWRTLGQ